MKKINIIQLLQKIQSGTQPKTIKVFGSYYDWNGEDYFNKDHNEYIYDRCDLFFLKDLVNKYCIEIPEPVSLEKAEKKWMEAIIELLGFSRDVTINKKHGWYKDCGSDSIIINIKCANGTCRGAVFDKSYFTGMELDHDYTADDLGLFNEEDK